MLPPSRTPVSRFYPAMDGLKLHLRDYPGDASGIPVVCLPGLARTAEDFSRLADALAGPRRVVALDYRGRGLSDYDPEWQHYDIGVESADILTVLDAAGIEQAVVIGTSRGGLHAMVLAAVRPALLRGVVLNDIGPVLETEGLKRIRSYVGKLPLPASWEEAVAIARRTMATQFTYLDDATWAAYARLTFQEKDGRFEPRYDTQLMKTLETLDLDAPLPQLWPQFEALAPIPTLVLRGENSDLLSPDTLAEMARRHPRCETHVVPGQGHAPLLLDPPTIDRVVRFVETVSPDPSALG